MDLLISTLDCQLVGYWHHSCLLPMVGHDVCSDQQSNVSLNCHNRLITPSQGNLNDWGHKLLQIVLRRISTKLIDYLYAPITSGVIS